MLLAPLLAVISALSYGVSDYCTAIATRRLGLLPATAVSYLIATALAGISLAVTGGTWSLATVGWSLAAALATIGGLLGFYQAAAIGPMSLVSPIISVLESAVPVAVATVLGERLGGWGWIAVALAIVGSVLMSLSSQGGGRLRLSTAALSLGSGLLLGVSVVFLDQAPADAGGTPAFLDLTGGLVVLVMLLAAGSRRRRRSRAALGSASTATARGLALPALSGLLLGVANILLVIALQHGDLAVVGVLVSLYPVSTIVLARALGAERPSPWQWTGIGCALAASALFAS